MPTSILISRPRVANELEVVCLFTALGLVLTAAALTLGSGAALVQGLSYCI